jgi:hypothetical protein
MVANAHRNRQGGVIPLYYNTIVQMGLDCSLPLAERLASTVLSFRPARSKEQDEAARFEAHDVIYPLGLAPVR